MRCLTSLLGAAVLTAFAAPSEATATTQQRMSPAREDAWVEITTQANGSTAVFLNAGTVRAAGQARFADVVFVAPGQPPNAIRMEVDCVSYRYRPLSGPNATWLADDPENSRRICDANFAGLRRVALPRGLNGQVTTSTPAVSQRPAAQVIWHNLSAGMSRADVRRLYPNSRVQIVAGCEARVDGSYVSNRLARVDLRSARSEDTARCPEVIAATLISRYGDPERRTEFNYDNCQGGAAGVISLIREICRLERGDIRTDRLHHFGWISGGNEIVLTLKEECRHACAENEGPIRYHAWSVVYRPLLRPDTSGAPL